MNKSGATLAWAYFHPHEPVPLFVAYVEDRDLWRKALPGSDDFFAVYSILPHEFEVRRLIQLGAYIFVLVNIALVNINVYS
jgi:hypothetical protein